ncbi:MAG: ArsA family ATPase [Deltaproteobacteria bacterium]|nr:MAG: ArsA family ATPase [Deltaproteobacteria bacterium]
MRIIMFAGKGGVGKTSIASATGLKAAGMGYKTLIMSLDIAHSLSDIFSLNKGLMDKNKGIPVKIEDRLWIQELDIQEEIQRNWGDVHKYIASLFHKAGLDEILAEELAILPGMEEVSSLLYINRYAHEGDFDVIILDCAPTGESLRFISIPTILEWYISKIFKIERRLVSYIRPVAKRFYDVPLPEDDYFKALENLFVRLEGVDNILTDPTITTVRLVTNPEKIVLKETQRSFLYFSLYKMCIDAVVMNRILPGNIEETYFNDWKKSQRRYLELAEEYFNPVPIFPVVLFQNELLGKERLKKFGEDIYGEHDPTEHFYTERPYEFNRKDGKFFIKIKLPFLTKEEIELNRLPEEMVIRVGGFKRHILLPRYVSTYKDVTAKIDGTYLNIIFGGNRDEKEKTQR